MAEEIINKLSAYPKPTKEPTSETLTGQLLIRECLMSPKEHIRKICGYMLNYMSADSPLTKDKRVNYEHTCLVITLLLTNRIVIPESEKTTIYSEFITAINDRKMKHIRKKYVIPQKILNIPNTDPNTYGNIRLSSNVSNLLSRFSLTYLPPHLHYHFEEPSTNIIKWTEIYEHMYKQLFMIKPRQYTLRTIFTYLTNIELIPRVNTPIEIINHMVITHVFKSPSHLLENIIYNIKTFKNTNTSYLYNNLRNLRIYADNTNITEQPAISLTEIYLYEKTLPSPHTFTREIISRVPTTLSLITITYAEGSIGFLSRESSAI